MDRKVSVIIASILGLNFNIASASNLAVTIPDLKPGFEFNVAALWLKPAASNLNYVIYNKGLPLQSPSWTEREVHPDYSAGFELGMRYVMECITGVDVDLTWTHLNTTDSDSVAADSTTYFLGPDYEIGPTGIPIRTASGSAQFQYNVVNLDVGQFVQFGNWMNMRFFGGLSTSMLREIVRADYRGNTTGTYAGPFSTTQTVTADFNGIGPRAGIHTDVKIAQGFSILGEAAASAIFGSQATKTTYVSSAQQLLVVYGQTNNYQTIADERVFQVIPAFDGKIGLNYQYVFKQMLFSISAGYQASVFVNAISQYLPQSLVAGSPLETGGIFVATMAHKLSNYSVQGPFLNFALTL